DILKALEYYQKSLAVARETNNKKSAAIVLVNIGSLYMSYPDPDCKQENTVCKELAMKKAMDYFKEGYQIAVDINDKRAMASNTQFMGEAYRELYDCSCR